MGYRCAPGVTIFDLIILDTFLTPFKIVWPITQKMLSKPHFYLTVGFTIIFCVQWVLTDFHFWFSLCHKWGLNFLCLLTLQVEYNKLPIYQSYLVAGDHLTNGS